MPITGPPPNPNSRRRNTDTFADVTPAEGTPAPDMTEALHRMRPATREWWAALVDGPAAHTYASTDWEVAKAALQCHDLRERAKADPALWVKLDARMERFENRLSFTRADRLKARVSGASGKRRQNEDVPEAKPDQMDVELYELLNKA